MFLPENEIHFYCYTACHIYLHVLIMSVWEVHGVYKRVFIVWLGLGRQLRRSKEILRKKKEDKTACEEEERNQPWDLGTLNSYIEAGVTCRGHQLMEWNI